MAKVFCIDDYAIYAEMVAEMIRRHGHEVKVAIVPLNEREIEDFGPDLIVVNLVRRLDTLSRGGIRDFDQEVEGSMALREIARSRPGCPLVVTAIGLEEKNLPAGLAYDTFVVVPQQMDRLLEAIERLAGPGG